ncbi:MAG: hypothetical protein EAZ92_16020 [Candidatus Kapaibacterium sp.]|nr:MAG: hypothetical protein EAZ92_16020 [Candidatus Kapabacteria bacterium]
MQKQHEHGYGGEQTPIRCATSARRVHDCVLLILVSVIIQSMNSCSAVAQTLAHTAYSDHIRGASIDSLLAQAEFLRAREPKKARAFAQAAYNRAVSAENLSRQAQALMILGYTVWVQGLFEESLRYSLESYRLTEKVMLSIPDSSTHAIGALHRQICILTRQIGNVYVFQRNFSLAETYFTKALAKARDLNDTNLIVLSLNNVGAISYYQNRFDSAMTWYERAAAFCSETTSTEYAALTFLNLGQTSAKQGKNDDALNFATRGLFICNAIGEKRYAISALLTIAAVQRTQSRFADAETALKQAIHRAEELGSLEFLRDSYAEYTLLAEAKKRYPEALQYERLQQKYNDSMFSQQSANRIAALSAIHQEEEQRQEIALLRETTRNQHFIRNSLLAGVLMLGVLAVLFWNRYRLKQRSESALRQKNEEILQQQYELQQQSEEIFQFNVEISARNEELAKANLEKNELMGIVAHDLKNPLAGIQGMAYILQMDKSQENTEQAIEHIISASKRMFGLIENLLDVNALESGVLTLSPQALDSVSIVQSVIEQLRQAAEVKNIRIALSSEQDCLLLHADRNAFVQVTENLISNAVKYSPQGKTVYVSLSIVGKEAEGKLSFADAKAHHFTALVPETRHLLLAVRDEGPGISAEDQQKLFGKFVRLSARPTGGEHSTGLGLSIVKKLVVAMQGHVWCESEFGKGATFFVEWPQV